MKTSNKLLLVFFLALFFSAASLMVYAKSHMVEGPVDMDGYYYGDGVVIEKTMLDDLTVANIEMGDNFTYLVDPTRTDVTIKGDSTFISQLTVVQEDQFRILTGGVKGNQKWPNNVYVVIGVKNLETLNLDINGNADVSASQALTYDFVQLDVRGNGRCTIDLTTNKIDIKSNGNSRLTLNGSSDDLIANSNGNSRLNFENFQLGSVNVDINGNAKFYGDTAQSLKGHANGNAKVTFNEVKGVQNISSNGNARFTIRN